MPLLATAGAPYSSEGVDLVSGTPYSVDKDLDVSSGAPYSWDRER